MLSTHPRNFKHSNKGGCEAGIQILLEAEACARDNCQRGSSHPGATRRRDYRRL